MPIGSYQKPRRGISDRWISPPEVARELGPFDLDPCTDRRQPWPMAKRMIVLPRDGLAVRWRKGQYVFLNPPYSQVQVWLAKLARHGNGIALTFARVETVWFFEEVWDKASAVFFPRGRLTFYTPDGRPGNGRKGGSGGPSVLIAYGMYAMHRLRTIRMAGKLVELSTYRDNPEGAPL